MQKKKLFRSTFLVLLIILIILGTFFGLLFLNAFGKIASKADLLHLQNENSSLVYSQDQKLIGKFFSENRTNIYFDVLPKKLVEALIATEDARFYEHDGVDIKGMFRVLFKTIILGNRSAGGGSTISQQLAKNIFGRKDYGKLGLYINKFKEIVLAYRIEEVFSKDEIIALYLNTVPFGENVYGIESASRRFFNKHTTDLTIEEGAVLVGLLKANSYYNPRSHPENALHRRGVVLSQMKKYGYLSLTEYDSLQALPLDINYTNLLSDQPAAYFLQKVKQDAEDILSKTTKNEKKYNLEKDGLIIHTTLNLQLHQLAQQSLYQQIEKMQTVLSRQYRSNPYATQLRKLAQQYAQQNKIDLKDDKKQKRNIFLWNDTDTLVAISRMDSLKHILSQLHAGFLAMDPQNGAIRAWVGGINHQYYPYDQITAKRQMASTFKPILYATALENGTSPCDYLSNEAVKFSDYEGWSPQNYSGKSGGKYSVAAALAYSKNIPTLHLYFQTPWDKINDLWQKMGFSSDLKQEPSIILGISSVNMLELAIAYSSFANNGKSPEPYLIESIQTADGKIVYQHPKTKLTPVLPVEIAQQINEILLKATQEGTGVALPNRYGLRTSWAGKTGTSQDYADAWYIGYNSKMLMVSRVGASFPSIHFNSGHYGTGSQLALPIVGKVLAKSKNFKWYNAGLEHSDEIDCDDFRESSGLKKFLNSFKNEETTLEKEKEKAQRKKKRKGFFKRLFGK